MILIEPCEREFTHLIWSRALEVTPKCCSLGSLNLEVVVAVITDDLDDFAEMLAATLAWSAS